VSSATPARSEDQRALAAALARYDREAWRRFFDDNYQTVFRFAYARLGHVTDAEDATSATFLAAVRSIDRFSFRGVPVAGWLLRIARHETANVHRKNHRRRASPLDMELGDDAASPDARIDLVRALKTLRPEVRAVVVLRLVEGLSIGEVAAILGKSEGAVKMMQGRALRKLRAELEGGSEGET
jgi:RNA polymerase sigma-70 factor (ECF subfamily)